MKTRKLERREFIRQAAVYACGSIIAPGLVAFSPQRAFGQSCAGRRKVIVHVFLDGGPHCPSILVPRNSQAYIDRHPTLKILSPIALNGNANHGINPVMTNLAALYNSGKVAIGSGAGMLGGGQSRSHDVARSRIGFASVDPAHATGWAGRYIKTYCAPAERLAVFSFNGTSPEVRATGLSVPSSYSLGSYGFSTDSLPSGASVGDNEAFVRQTIIDVRKKADLSNPHFGIISSSWDVVNETIPLVAAVRSAYPTSGAPSYPVDSNSRLTPMGMRFQGAAQLVNASNVDVQFIEIRQGGYDTHTSQESSPNIGDRLSTLLTDLDLAIGAFWQDLLRLGRANDVVLICHGEFGRTVENGNNGTDHGEGGILFAVGQRLNPGVFSQPYTDADFPASTSQKPWQLVKLDIRELLWEVMADHMGVDPAPIFPESFQRVGLNILA